MFNATIGACFTLALAMLASLATDYADPDICRGLHPAVAVILATILGAALVAIIRRD